MFLKDSIKEYENILPLNTISKLIRVLNKNYENYHEAQIVGNGGQGIVDKDVRDVKKIYLVDSDWYKSFTLTHWGNLLSFVLLKYVNEYRKIFHHVGRNLQINQMEALRYEKGGHYRMHVDESGTPTIGRQISCVLLLNNDYEGGNLIFDVKEKNYLEIKNAPAKLIMWPSNYLFPHTITPVTKGIRHSIVSWLC
jgi:hypothetical protein